MYSIPLDRLTGEASTTVVVRDTDGATIPRSDTNRDYLDFLAWEAKGNTATEPAAPAKPVPATIRLLQFLAQAVAVQMITPEEALAAARTGAVPAAFEAIFATLPPEQAFGARLAWAGMYEVDRASPLLVVVAAAQGMTEADMDQFFIEAGAR